MDKSKQYRQCSMSSKQEDGSVLKHVAYLPSEKAKVGKAVDVELGGKWVEGFVIESMGTSVTIEDVDKARENLKRYQWVLGK
jgi:hypothetical protein